MSLTKRIVSAVTAVALIIAACLFGSVAMPYAGRGNGKDAKVTTLSQVSDLLGSADIKNNKNNGEYYSGALLVNGDSEPLYTAYTMMEVTTAYASGYVTYNGKTSSETISFDRVLTIYKTENAVYYLSEGRYTSSTDIDGEKSKVNETWKMRAYMSGENVYLYIDNLVYSDSSDKDNDTIEVTDILSRNRYRWLDCSAHKEIADPFIEINDSNVAGLAEIADFINKEMDKGDYETKNYTKRGNVYRINKKGMEECLGFSGKGKFEITVNSTEPEIYYDVVYEKKEDSDIENNMSANYSMEQYISVEDTITFKYINNTVIELGDIKLVDIKDIMPDEEE